MVKNIHNGPEFNSDSQKTLKDSSPEQSAKHFDAQTQDHIEVSGNGFISNATMTQDGVDLVLTAPSGETIIIDNYFISDPKPSITSPEGQRLSPELVDSFMVGDARFASTDSLNDESAIGIVTEFSGEGTVTRPDGTTHILQSGMSIFQGDIIETEFDAAVNITFIDESSLSIGEDARMAIDEFVFDPATNDGTTNVSILRGVFMYTSGLMGRDNPDSVELETPVGSIGIRGTIIGGKITADGQDSQITVVEGAIVVTNGAGQQILSNQFETVKLGGFDSPIENIGQIDAGQINQSYGSVRSVSGNLFSSIDTTTNNNGENSNNDGNSANAEDGNGDTTAEGEAQGGEGTSEQGEQGEQAAEGANADSQNDNNEGQDAESEAESEASESNADAEASESNTDADSQNDSSESSNGATSDTPAEDASLNQQGNQPASDLGQQQMQPSEGTRNNNSGPRADGGSRSTGNNASDNNTNDQSNNNTATNPIFIDRAPQISVSNVFSIEENDTSEQVLATLNIQDPDAKDSINLNRIRIGNKANGEGPFEVKLDSTTGEYQLIKKAGMSFNFEQNVSDPSSFVGAVDLTIRVFDDNTSANSVATLPIVITNQNETPEIEINSTSSSADYHVSEILNSPQNIAVVHVADPDAASLFNDNDITVSDARFEIHTDADGNTFLRSKDGQIFDHETESSVDVDIIVTDANDPTITTTQTITVNITDVNEAPTFSGFNQIVSSVDENTDGQTIATFTIGDPDDATSGFDNNIVTVNNSNFEIVGNELRLKSGSAFDYETDDGLISLTLTVADANDGTLQSTQSVPVIINNINEAPTLAINNADNTGAFSFSVDENTAASTDIATLVGTDEEGNALNYSITGTDSSAFSLNGDKLQFSASPDFEIQDTYDITIEVNDGNSTTSENITINIADVAEAPTDLLLNDDSFFDYFSGTTYDSNVANEVRGAVIGIIDFVDQDSSDFTPSDFTISHPTDGAINLDNFLEVAESADPYGNPTFVLKLQSDVSLTLDATANKYTFIKSGTAYDFDIDGNANGEFNADGNGKYAFDVNIELNDTAAGTNYSENFKISVENSVINVEALNGVDGFIIGNDARNIGISDPEAYFGSSVTTLDYNGDGTLDIAVGAPNAFNADVEASGGIYILPGNSLSPFDFNHTGVNSDNAGVALTELVNPGGTIPGYFEESIDANDNNGEQYGRVTSNLGDVNGDGFDDLIVSHSGQSQARVILGGNLGPSGSFNITSLPLNGTEGISLANVGDIDGDGFNDIVIGISGDNNGGENPASGSVFALYGNNTLGSGDIDIQTPPGGVTIHEFQSPTVTDNAEFGDTVASAGDITGDGFADLIVGETGYNSGAGRVHIYFGNNAGPQAWASFTTSLSEAALGAAATSIGDINQDGLDDILVTADQANGGTGRAYVLYGTTTAANTDIDAYTNTAANGFAIQYGATAAGNEGLGYSVAGGGDFNGDGVSDFVITGINGQMIDTAFVVFGGTTLNSYLGSNANTLNLDDIYSTSSLGMLIEYSSDLNDDGNFTEDQFMSVSFSGDINEDGFDDIVLGAESYIDGAGATYVIYGRDSFDQTTFWQGTTVETMTFNGQQFVGNHDDNKVTDDGLSGLVANGARGNDTIKISNTDFTMIDGGQDVDTLKLEFSKTEGSAEYDAINLRGLNQGSIESIENFFIHSGANGGQDTLQLNIDDVVSLLHQSDNGELRFTTDGANGNAVRFYANSGAGGPVALPNDYRFEADSDGQTETIGSNEYYRFGLTGTDYSVLIDSQLVGASTGGDI